MYGIYKNIQLNIRTASQVVEKFPGESKGPWDIGSPLAFSVNETLSFHEKS